MEIIRSVICEHIDLSFIKSLKLGFQNYIVIRGVKSVFSSDEISRLINHDVLLMAISHNIFSDRKNDLERKIKNVVNRFSSLLKSIRESDIQNYIRKKYKKYNDAQISELQQKMTDYLGNNLSHIFIMSYIASNKLKNIISDHSNKIIDNIRLDISLSSPDGSKRDVITVSLDNRIRTLLKDKMIYFLNNRGKNMNYLYNFFSFFLSETLNSDFRSIRSLEEYANMMKEAFGLISVDRDCGSNRRLIDIVESKKYRDVNYIVTILGPLHLGVIDYLDRMQLNIEEVLNIASSSVENNLSGTFQAVKTSRTKGYSETGSEKGRRDSDLYRTAKTRINFAGTELGKFVKDIFDTLSDEPISKAFKYLFSLSSSIGKAIDVRFGTGRGADLISRLETFVNDWELNLGDTEYSDLIKYRKQASKKKSYESDYKKDQEEPEATYKTQSRMSGVLFGNRSEVKDTSMQASTPISQTGETKEDQQKEEKEEEQVKEQPQSQTPTGVVSKKQEEVMKKIYEEILFIKNMLSTSGSTFSGQKNVQTDTQVQNIFQNIVQKVSKTQESEQNQEKSESKEEEKEEEKSTSERSQLMNVYQNILKKGGNINMPDPLSLKSGQQDVHQSGTGEVKYPLLSEIKDSLENKLERSVPQVDGNESSDQKQEKEEQKENIKKVNNRDSLKRNISSILGGKSQPQVSQTNQTTYNIASVFKTDDQQNISDKKIDQNENKNEQKEESEGISLGDILKHIISGLSMLLPLVFGALSIGFFIAKIKKLFMPDVEFSGNNIDFEKISEMSEEQKEKMKSDLENRYKKLSQMKFDAQKFDALYDYTRIGTGKIEQEELIVPKSNLKKVERTAPERDIPDSMRPKSSYDVFSENNNKAQEQSTATSVQAGNTNTEARLSELERAFIESLTSHTQSNQALAKIIGETYRDTNAIKNKRPEELGEP